MAPCPPSDGRGLSRDEFSSRLGEAVGGELHTGRRRNDRSSAAVRLATTERILEVTDALLGVREAVPDRAAGAIALADLDAAAAMIGRTGLFDAGQLEAAIDPVRNVHRRNIEGAVGAVVSEA